LLVDCFDMQQIWERELDKEDIAKFQDKVDGAGNILIFTHKNPDPDAVGSVMALSRFLIGINKKHKIFLPQQLSENFFYLKEPVDIIQQSDLAKENFDLVIGLDCSNLDWSGAEDILAQKKQAGVYFINIDHHTNSCFADINIVDKDSASTSLILYKIFKSWVSDIDEIMATQILAGVVADTNGFTNGATSIEAYRVAGELLGLGARYNYVINKFQKNDHNSWFRLWAKVLSRLTKNDKIKLAYSVVLSEDINDGEGAVLDGATNFLSNLEGMRLAIILKENQDGEIKVSLRSIEETINVANLANYFGGGGHARAAGFSIKGRLEKEGNYWQIV
jgi:bifunctional oligoribonuclease and PAP phosphatase NrnA